MPEPLKDPKKVMPAPTAWLFDEIRTNPLLGRFILIGGTGLSLHIGHRMSEDLDLITLESKLPRTALKELQRQLESSGHQIEHRINPAAYDDFQISGMELEDSQQDWVVDSSVKLTFFAGEPKHAKLLATTNRNDNPEGGIKVASFQELCQLKAIVTASRSKSRDWLDLFILERDHQFGVAKWKDAFDKAGLSPMDFEIALNRMCRGLLSEDDEGYDTLIPNPPNIEEMKNRFRSLRKAYETNLASIRAKEMGGDHGNSDTPSNP